MGELATEREDLDRYLKDGFQMTSAPMVERVTSVITTLEKDQSLYPKDWVIPGGTPGSAALDQARTICRRAERVVSGLDKVNPETLRYLNRVSDLCWILARYSEKQNRVG